MKKSNNGLVTGLIALVVVGGVAAVAFFTMGNNTSKVKDGTIVAHVNGKPIYSSEAEAQLNVLTGGKKTPGFAALDEKSRYVVIKEIAAQKLVLAEAYKKGIDKTDAVKEKLSDIRDKLVKEEFIAEMAKDAVNDASIKARYDDLVTKLKGRDQVKVRHILVNTEEEAKKIEEKLEKSQSFESLAKSESIDKSTSSKGGDLGYLITGNMIKEFEDAIKNMKAGEVSPPVKTNLGWHVIKLVEKKPAEAAPFDKIKDRLSQEVAAEAVQSYVSKLLDKAEIEVASIDDLKANGDSKEESKTEAGDKKADESKSDEGKSAKAEEKKEESTKSAEKAKESHSDNKKSTKK